MNIKGGDNSKRWDAAYKSGEYDAWMNRFEKGAQKSHRIERRNAKQALKTNYVQTIKQLSFLMHKIKVVIVDFII